MFFINLPIGLATLVAAHYTLPKHPHPHIPTNAIDGISIPLLIGDLNTLVLDLMQDQTWS